MKAKRITIIAMAASMIAFSTAAVAQSVTANGEVKKIDAAAGKITIKHGPIKALDMEDPMTMVYRVQDPEMLKQVKAGDYVNFDVDRANGALTITKIQKTK